MALEVNSDGYVVSTEQPTVSNEWMTALEELLQGLPNVSLLTPLMKTTALLQSQVPDSMLVWPGEDGYVPTYDIYFAAINLIGFLRAQPVVRQTSSEGTSVAVDAPNWGALIEYYRSLSTIVAASGNRVLQSVAIPRPPSHVKKTDMSGYDSTGRMTHYANVDTDVS